MFAECDDVSDSVTRHSRICCTLPRTKHRPLKVRRLCVAFWTPAHRHTYLWTQCPQLQTCLGIPRITTAYRLKIGGNHCLHAVAQPAGGDSTGKIISFYLTGLLLMEENIAKTSAWHKSVTYQNSSSEAAVTKHAGVSLRSLASTGHLPGVAAHRRGHQEELCYN